MPRSSSSRLWRLSDGGGPSTGAASVGSSVRGGVEIWLVRSTPRGLTRWETERESVVRGAVVVALMLATRERQDQEWRLQTGW